MVGKKEYAQINSVLNRTLEEKGFLIAVHRGSWHANIIENTISAAEIALKMGADMFEVDVSKSTDGQLYMFHDSGEPRLFHKEENITTMSSQEIDALTYFNSLGEPTTAHVQHLEDLVSHFTGDVLYNIDRSWRWLPELHEVLKGHPHVLNQAVIKTPVKEEYLEFFQNCPDKYMYMPICYSMEDVKTALSYTDINIVGVEAIAPNAQCDMFQKENIQWMKDQGLYVWINAITLSDRLTHILSAGYDDNTALTNAPDAAWGVLINQGYNVVQTDWPAILNQYRAQMG